MAEEARSGLADRLPAVRGRLEPDFPLREFTWFRVGGPAEVLFTPADSEDLSAFLRDLNADVPVGRRRQIPSDHDRRVLQCRL